MTGESLAGTLNGLDVEAPIAAAAYDPEVDPEVDPEGSVDAVDETASRGSQEPASSPVDHPAVEQSPGNPDAAQDVAQEKKREAQQMRRYDRLMNGHRLEKFNFSDDFQDLILACMVRHPDKFAVEGEIIQPKFFNGSAAYDACYEVREWLKEYGTYPDFTILGNLILPAAGIFLMLRKKTEHRLNHAVLSVRHSQ